MRLKPKVFALEVGTGTSGEAIPCGNGREPEITDLPMNDKRLKRNAVPIRSHQRADVACQSRNARTIQAKTLPQFTTKATQANGNSNGDRTIGSFIAHHRTTGVSGAGLLASDIETVREAGIR